MPGEALSAKVMSDSMRLFSQPKLDGAAQRDGISAAPPREACRLSLQQVASRGQFAQYGRGLLFSSAEVSPEVLKESVVAESLCSLLTSMSSVRVPLVELEICLRKYSTRKLTHNAESETSRRCAFSAFPAAIRLDVVVQADKCDAAALRTSPRG